MTGWVSTPELMVDATGQVPIQVLTALAGLGGSSTWEAARRGQVQRFLVEVCLELAHARAQVVNDRAELDRLRVWHALAKAAEKRSAA